MKAVVLVGTAHTIQLGQLGDIKAFEERLLALCNEFEVLAIGEEMSTDVLASRGVSETIGARVARKLGLPHIYCDPSPAERKRLDITSVQDIQLQAFHEMWTDQQKRDRLAEHFATVERYWLDRLRDTNKWPALYVCGANHVDSFGRLLEASGHRAPIADADWGA
jgi:hypothetical protein